MVESCKPRQVSRQRKKLQRTCACSTARFFSAGPWPDIATGSSVFDEWRRCRFFANQSFRCSCRLNATHRAAERARKLPTHNGFRQPRAPSQIKARRTADRLVVFALSKPSPNCVALDAIIGRQARVDSQRNVLSCRVIVHLKFGSDQASRVNSASLPCCHYLNVSSGEALPRHSSQTR